MKFSFEKCRAFGGVGRAKKTRFGGETTTVATVWLSKNSVFRDWEYSQKIRKIESQQDYQTLVSEM